MKKYAIVFDVDGVITDSASKKYEAFSATMQKHNIENHPEIARLLELRVNRSVLSNAVFEIFGISSFQIFQEIGDYLKEYESEWKCYPMYPQVREFIEQHHEEYLFFTNTAMQKKTVENIFHSLWLSHFFEEIFAYDTGTKLENIQKIISSYELKPENILFIDDLEHNIESVKSTWVHTLLFDADSVHLEKCVKGIFRK